MVIEGFGRDLATDHKQKHSKLVVIEASPRVTYADDYGIQTFNL